MSQKHAQPQISSKILQMKFMQKQNPVMSAGQTASTSDAPDHKQNPFFSFKIEGNSEEKSSDGDSNSSDPGFPS